MDSVSTSASSDLHPGTINFGKHPDRIGGVLDPAVMEAAPAFARMTRANALKLMIATSFATMFLIFAVASGIVVGYLLIVRKFLDQAK